MKKTHDRRFLGMLGFLGFLGCLGFLGSENYQHLARFAWLASFASLSCLVFIPRNASKVDSRYHLDSVRDILSALAGNK